MTDHSELIARVEQARSDYEYAKSARVAVAPGRAYALLDELVPALKEAQATAATARQIIQELTDSDPCSFDHHGDCQAHGFFDLSSENPCGHEKAKRFLAAEASQ